MAGLKQFKFIPQNMLEWSKWMRDQELEPEISDPDGLDRVLGSDTDGTREWVRRFDCYPAQYRGSTNQSLSATPVTVDLVTEDANPSARYSVESDVVLVSETGWYKVTYECFASVDSTAGTTQCNLLAWLAEADQSTVIDGSYSAAFILETGTPDASCGTAVIKYLAEGEGVCIRASLSAATDVSTVADRCKLIIERVR